MALSPPEPPASSDFVVLEQASATASEKTRMAGLKLHLHLEDNEHAIVGAALLAVEIAQVALLAAVGVQDAIAAVVRDGACKGTKIRVGALSVEAAKVAFLVAIDHAVSAIGTEGAGGGAPAVDIVSVGRAAVWVAAVVARLVGGDDAVTAHGLYTTVAGAAGVHPWAQHTGLNPAGLGATIAAFGIAVVAFFVADESVVATKRRAPLSRYAALPAVFDGSAVAGATITVNGTTVVAGLVRGDDSIAASGGLDAWLSRLRAIPVGFDLAETVATVAAEGVAVIASLFDVE